MLHAELEGLSLGGKHRHFNELVNKTITGNNTTVEKINFNDVDLDNLFRIDVACKTKNVDYVLEVLKSEDSLYVSRALKRSVWLVTDPKYAHIINPDYLHNHLFPYMTTKAIYKLMLLIRLNLKDEKRVEPFYNYYKLKDEKIAVKWLQHCSVRFIENELKVLEEAKSYSSLKYIKRLFEKSITIFKTYYEKLKPDTPFYLYDAIFLINTDFEKYMDIVESIETGYLPYFNAKYTKKVMKKSPNRFIENFEKCYERIDIKTFAKYFRGDVKEFLLKFNVKTTQIWLEFKKVKYFMEKVPINERYELLKTVCFDGRENDIRFYQFVPFEIAFEELKTLIHKVSKPEERINILKALVACAGRNQQHISTVLAYYQEKHRNEQFKFKIKFLNRVVKCTDTHRFDNETWNILNDIFCSCDIYTETVNSEQQQQCVQAIVVYKVVHDESVSQVLEKKFKFDTLKSLQGKFNPEEKERVFEFLYNYLVNKIKSKNLQIKEDFLEVLDLAEKMLQLLIDWKKDITQFPWVLELIMKVKQSNTWTVNLSNLYTKNKSWRKFMFEESMLLYPSENVCINILKHKPQLLEQYKNELEDLFRKDSTSLYKLLSKIKIYWPNTLAKEWSQYYIDNLEKQKGQKALVRGLFILLPQKQALEIAKKYAPTENEKNWNNDSEFTFNLRREIAKNLHRTRPHPPLDVVMLYAHTDYSHFSIPSICAVLHNMSTVSSRDYVDKLVNAPVTLQKHAIRHMISKLDLQELKEMYLRVWKSANDSMTRSVLFIFAYNSLRREKLPAKMDKVWELMSMTIDNLSQDEHISVYNLLGKVRLIPKEVRGKFCMKSYNYLNSLPASAKYEAVMERIMKFMKPVFNSLDTDFLSDMLLDSVTKNRFTSKKYIKVYNTLLASYLLCSNDVKSQMAKCDKVLIPYMQQCFENFDRRTENDINLFKIRLIDILNQLTARLTVYVFERKMVIPVTMFNAILKELEKKLSYKNYVLLRTWKLTTAFVELLEDRKELKSSPINVIVCVHGGGDPDCPHCMSYKDIDKTLVKLSPAFAEICLEYLKMDVENNTLQCLLFADALQRTLYNIMSVDYESVNWYFSRGLTFYLDVLKSMLKSENLSSEAYLIILKCLPESEVGVRTCYHKYDEITFIEIRKIFVKIPLTVIRMHYFRKYHKCNLLMQ